MLIMNVEGSVFALLVLWVGRGLGAYGLSHLLPLWLVEQGWIHDLEAGEAAEEWACDACFLLSDHDRSALLGLFVGVVLGCRGYWLSLVYDC